MNMKKLFSNKWLILLQIMLVAVFCFKLYVSLYSSENIDDCTNAVKNNDYEKAYMACSNHAAKGNRLAKILLGRMYDDGLYVQKDLEQAEKLYAEVANDNSQRRAQRTAQSCLGDLYRKKEFAKYDLKRSADWFRLSADLGYGKAQFKYGILSFLGYGTEKNLDLAKVYLKKASKNGMKKEVDLVLPLLSRPDTDIIAKEMLNKLNQ